MPSVAQIWESFLGPLSFTSLAFLRRGTRSLAVLLLDGKVPPQLILFSFSLTDLNIIFYTYPFLVPAYFALITRAMIVLEGIALTGDPDFDLFQSAYPYASRRAVSLFGLSNLSEIAMEAAKNYEFLKLDIPH